MSATATTVPATPTAAEKALAVGDYQTLTALAHAVQKMQAEQQSVAEASLRLMAACAEDLAKAAREVETIIRMSDLTGVAARHPELWALASEGKMGELNEGLHPLIVAAYAR